MEAFVGHAVADRALRHAHGQALSVFAEGLRTKRRLRAEELAAKTAIKMIFPLVLFIFPSMFIVLLGPAVLSVMHNLAGCSTEDRAPGTRERRRYGQRNSSFV